MKRLTTRCDGRPALAQGIKERFTEPSLFFMLLNRLAAYEDTGLSPETVNDLVERFTTITQTSNDPLTPEQIREMDGEPVWIETADIKKANRWAFVDVGCEIVRFFDTRCGVKCTVMGNHFRTYGKTWLAYRRKPEAPANAE